jgi:calcineurin-like phosphoesterase family protein
MIENWNKTVRDGDKVYHLGDVFFGSRQKASEILYRLKGQKRLVVGNHDVVFGKDNPLQMFFKKIYMWRMFPEFGLTLTHVPIHQDSFRKTKMNIHGHTHEKGSPEGPYKSVCVELINYTPVNIEELRAK